MYLRSVAVLTLVATNGFDSTDTASNTEVDFNKYFVNPGKREMKAILSAKVEVASDSGSFDYKLQESNTTVDSDFSDISGATFTQQTDGSTAAFEQIHFYTNKRYVRGFATISGGSWNAFGAILATKRDSQKVVYE